jgi:hypothetical protein
MTMADEFDDENDEIDWSAIPLNGNSSSVAAAVATATKDAPRWQHQRVNDNAVTGNAAMTTLGGMTFDNIGVGSTNNNDDDVDTLRRQVSWCYQMSI